MTDSREIRSERADLASYSQFVQELIVGAVRRHTFTQWELELLLDMQLARVRKTARADLLRRYLRALHQQFVRGTVAPMRFSTFLEHDARQRGFSPSLVVRRPTPLRPAKSVA